mmetsp:Transcript_43036/g.101199  ORF Transcript_43036/g.101199 Transcript_43036/m.101199 type:complete len:230 (+) Transcript_43036:248-937(+)
MAGAPQGLCTCLLVTGEFFAFIWFISYMTGWGSTSPPSLSPSQNGTHVAQAQQSLQAAFPGNASHIQPAKGSGEEEDSQLHFLIVAACFIFGACCVRCIGNLSQPKASALHILFDSEPRCLRVKEELKTCKEEEVVEKFEDFAKRYSKCPSGKRGGSLGTFRRGAMAKEFDEAVFLHAEVGKVHGPVWTDFGMHLIFVTYRQEVKAEGHAGQGQAMATRCPVASGPRTE